MKQIFYLSIFFIFGLVFFVDKSHAHHTPTCSLTSPAKINTNINPTTITISGAYSTSFSQINTVKGLVIVGTITASTVNCTSIQDRGGGSISAMCDAGVVGPLANDIYFEVIYKNGRVACQTQHIPIIHAYPGTRCSISISPNPPLGGDSYSVTVNNIPSDITPELWIDTIHAPGGLSYFQVLGAGQLVEGTAYTQQPQSANTRVSFAVLGTTPDGNFYDINSPICISEFVVGLTPAPEPLPSGAAGSLGTTQICNFISDSGEREQCNMCFGRPGVWTPFGCIETDPQKFVEKILKIAIGMAGGIAFLMIIYGGFVTMTSSGNPEKLNEGREIITSAVAGLLLIIFSVVILKIIGVDILGIPGL